MVREEQQDVLSFFFVVSEDSREQGVDYSGATFRLWRAASVKAGHVGFKVK